MERILLHPVDLLHKPSLMVIINARYLSQKFPFFLIDSYTLYKLESNGTETKINIDETGISWKYDRDTFKNTDHLEKQWIDMTNGSFSHYIYNNRLENRAFSSVDAGCRTVEIQETLGKNHHTASGRELSCRYSE